MHEPVAVVQAGACDVVISQAHMLQTLCSADEARSPPSRAAFTARLSTRVGWCTGVTLMPPPVSDRAYVCSQGKKDISSWIAVHEIVSLGKCLL